MSRAACLHTEFLNSVFQRHGVVQPEIENVKKLGVKIETNVIIGKSVTIDELMDEEGFKAVFIGSGAGLPKFMGIPGENANGVFSANEYLTRSNLMKAFRDDYDTPIYAGQEGSCSRRRKRGHGCCQNSTPSGRRGAYCIQKKRERSCLPVWRKYIMQRKRESSSTF